MLIRINFKVFSVFDSRVYFKLLKRFPSPLIERQNHYSFTNKHLIKRNSLANSNRTSNSNKKRIFHVSRSFQRIKEHFESSFLIILFIPVQYTIKMTKLPSKHISELEKRLQIKRRTSPRSPTQIGGESPHNSS